MPKSRARKPTLINLHLSWVGKPNRSFYPQIRTTRFSWPIGEATPDGLHEYLRTTVAARWPGWFIQGYCPVRKRKTKKGTNTAPFIAVHTDHLRGPIRLEMKPPGIAEKIVKIAQQTLPKTAKGWKKIDSQIKHALAPHYYGPNTEEERAKVNKAFQTPPKSVDGPGAEDGPWAKGWKGRSKGGGKIKDGRMSLVKALLLGVEALRVRARGQRLTCEDERAALVLEKESDRMTKQGA